jgi:RIP homotypic interaction motif
VIAAAELVVAALSAGAAAGLTDTATAAVKDSYSGLKALTVKVLRRAKEDAAEELVRDPDAHREELVTALTAAAGDGCLDDLAEAAEKLLATLDPRGASAGKYRVELRDSQGVQIGDNNTMTIDLTADRRR